LQWGAAQEAWCLPRKPKALNPNPNTTKKKKKKKKKRKRTGDCYTFGEALCDIEIKQFKIIQLYFC
jgi:hypothetical protein